MQSGRWAAGMRTWMCCRTEWSPFSKTWVGVFEGLLLPPRPLPPLAGSRWRVP